MTKEELDSQSVAPSTSLDDGLETEDSIFKEFWTFLMENKIWWITPTVLILSLVIGFIIITAVTGGGPIAPFIYTFF